MEVLKGKQVEASIKIGESWLKVFCAISCVIRIGHEQVPISSRTTGKFRRRVSGIGDASITVNGLTKIDNSDGQVSFLYLAQAGVRGEAVELKVDFVDDDGNTATINGTVLVSETILESAVGDFARGNQFFPFDGAPNLGAVSGLVPTEIKKLYLSTTEGAYTVTHADLGGAVQILLVSRGSGYDWLTEVAGTPNEKQFKFIDNTTSGTIQVASTHPWEAGEVVYVEYETTI